MAVEMIKLIVLEVIILSKFASCMRGDPVVYFPPFELRAMPADRTPFVSVPNPNVMNEFQQQFQPQIHHKSIESVPTSPLPNRGENFNLQPVHEEPQPETKNSTVSVHDLLTALGLSDHEEHGKLDEEERAASGRDYEYPPYMPYARPPMEYGYPPRGYWPPPSYQSPYAYLPPTFGHTSPSTKPLSLLKQLPDKLPEISSLVKPVASKVAGKVSGLIGFVLALLTGSSTDDIELKGLKDIVINGIVKPLMAAKGGIKSLISKMAIPVIVLLLMNVEVLLLIWWLWEDCSQEPVHPPPVYPYPKPSYGYSSYNSYR